MSESGAYRQASRLSRRTRGIFAALSESFSQRVCEANEVPQSRVRVGVKLSQKIDLSPMRTSQLRFELVAPWVLVGIDAI